MVSLLDLPEDALADIVARLVLPRDALKLMLTCKDAATGAGRSSLSAAGLIAAAKLLDCQPGEVAKLSGSSDDGLDEDGLETANFVLRAHAPAHMEACSDHTLVLLSSGMVLSCGANEAGQLGNGIISQFSSTIYVPSPTYSSSYLAHQQQVIEKHDATTPSPVLLPAGVVPVAVAAGRSHSLLISACGNAFAWGLNDSGQLGFDGEAKVGCPRRVSFMDDAASVGVALGELALGGNVEDHPFFSLAMQPTLPLGRQRLVVQVAAGAMHSLFLMQTGEVLACGAGGNGELGTGECHDSRSPRRVLLPECACAIVSGGYHSLAISAGPERRVYGWGIAACGQLGPNADGSRELKQRATPTRVLLAPSQPTLQPTLQPPLQQLLPLIQHLPPCAQLSAGLHHTLLLTQSGGALSFGKGSNGALGHGDRQDVVEPKRVDALTGKRVLSVSAGSMHSAFVTHCGELYTCGNASHGRLGVTAALSQAGTVGIAPMPMTQRAAHRDAPVKHITLPVRVPLPVGRMARRVTAGNEHTLAVLDDGATYVFGRGQLGQLGCGDRVNQLTPCRVVGFDGPSVDPPPVDVSEMHGGHSTDTPAPAPVPPAASPTLRPVANEIGCQIVGGSVQNRFLR